MTATLTATKTCVRCGIEKSLDDFHRDVAHFDGRQTWCKTCQVNRRRRPTSGERRVTSPYVRALSMISEIEGLLLGGDRAGALEAIARAKREWA